MKKTIKIKSILLTVFSLIFILFYSIELKAQENIESEIILEIQKKDKTKEIKIGRKIRVWYEGEKHKGRLDSISPTSIFIGEKEFEIAQIEKLGIKFKGTQITGAILGTAGLVVSSFGGVLIYNAYQEDNAFGAVILIVAGVIVEIIGIPVLAIGSSMFLIGKKYKKEKGWSYKSVQVH